MKRFKLMKNLLQLTLLLLISVPVTAQDDLMNLINDDVNAETNYTTATFKSTRVMNGHSIERMPAGQLDFRVSHRFGTINSGAYNFFGLDQSNIHLSLEYGFTNRVMAGFGRGSYEKTFDAFTKFSLLRQSTGKVKMPVSLSILTSVALNTLKYTGEPRKNYFSSRLSYTGQVLIGRKISEAFSVQVSPSYVHRNIVATELDPNDIYAVGAGARMKIIKRISLNGEYYFVANPKKDFSQAIYNPLSVGFDIETGGHVFQLIFTNSLGMIEKAFIGETTGSWRKGDIHFGFNISRVFTVKKHS
jgi:hypothetical protein